MSNNLSASSKTKNVSLFKFVNRKCRVANLKRLTFLVLDEADRLFDMGFEHQIEKIVLMTRPDRQTVLFSATFPKAVERMAYTVLKEPIEIIVGGKSRVTSLIEQIIEPIAKNSKDRFLRLLQLMGNCGFETKVIIFVRSQQGCDALFRNLIQHSYPCLSLHGGHSQCDRESTLADFKDGVCNILVATSIASRGLDVHDLKLAINFDAPDHYEDYVHRVGRAGRLNNRGISITFLDPILEKEYIPDLIRALSDSKQPIIDQLLDPITRCSLKPKKQKDLFISRGSGYGGSGFKFDATEDMIAKKIRNDQAYSLGFTDSVEKTAEEQGFKNISFTNKNSQRCVNTITPTFLKETGEPNKKIFQELSREGKNQTVSALASSIAAQLAYQMSSSKTALGSPGPSKLPQRSFQMEFPINDLPLLVRRKVTAARTCNLIKETTGVTIVVKGRFFNSDEILPDGENKLYLLFDGPTESSLFSAMSMIRKVIEEEFGKKIRNQL
jgi:ATP-dependent RNA helicase DDX46/PRP5